MESLTIQAGCPKLHGHSKVRQDSLGHYSRDCFQTRAPRLKGWSVSRGGHAKFPLQYVREKAGSRGVRDWKCDVNATSVQLLESEPDTQNDSKSGAWDSVKSAADAFHRFSRPHTIIGTSLSVVSVSLLAVESMADISPLFFIRVLQTIVAALCMNVYVVGLNQLTDIDIDKVNKPYLPLASGEYSFGTGTLIVALSGILSFVIGSSVGSWPLLWSLILSFLLGTAYSVDLPLLRWKRFPVLAATCIFAVRALIVQLNFFLHFQTYVFQRPPVFPRTLIFATAFMSFFSVVIALFKDIPDIEGDATFGIRSLTVRLGQKKVFWICISLLEMAYAVAILFGSTLANPLSKSATVITHAILASALWVRARSLDLGSRDAITAFYMFIWKFFYAEYLLIPLMR